MAEISATATSASSGRCLTRRLPANASPFGTPAEKAAWAAMREADQRGVNRVFANIGKAIGAFERALPCRRRASTASPTRWRQEAAGARRCFTARGDAGLKLFIGKANCVTCHNGPRFTDGHFHNTGVPSVAGLPQDLGRETGVEQVAADPFNCLGQFRDGDAPACRRCASIAGKARTPPRLQDAVAARCRRPAALYACRPDATLEAVIDHDARAPGSQDGHSELNPLT